MQRLICSSTFPTMPSLGFLLSSRHNLYLQEQVPELLYVTTIDNEETYEDMSFFNVELNSRHYDERKNRDSDHYLQPFYPETQPPCEEVGHRKNPSGYSKLDSIKRILDDSASYQKLTRRQRAASV